jgi:hypothetical protein
VVGAAVVLLVVGAVIARRYVYSDRARPVSSNDVLRRYRASTTSAPASSSPAPTSTPDGSQSSTTSAPPKARLPQPGVYRYTTTGEESADILGGASHTYPPVTTLTVTPDTCGVHLRWDALQERRDEWRLCPVAGGLDEAWGIQFHEFFKQPNTDTIACPANGVLVPEPATPGQTWSVDCTLTGDPWPQQFTVAGPEPVQVGATTVNTVHVVEHIDVPVTYYEHTTIDWWFSADGLPVKVNEVKVSKSSSPIGAVTYHEHFSLVLQSVEPST